MDIYLQSFGARLRVKDGIFELTAPDITGANRHTIASYPAHEVSSILLQPGTSVSSDALLLALQKGTDILVLDKFGEPQGRLFSNRPSSTLLIWKNQLSIAITHEAIGFAKGWIEEKIIARLALLNELKKHRNADKIALIKDAESQIIHLLAKFRAIKITAAQNLSQIAQSIRAYEGNIGKIFFNTLSNLLPEVYRFSSKDQRPATDLFFAFLFYGYGILYRHVEKALHLAGVHPYIGFFHTDSYQHKSMVYDFIEPYRVWVESIVFKLFSRKQLSMQQVNILPNNGLLLRDDARRLVSDAVALQLTEEKKIHRGRSCPLGLYLQEAAVEFATTLRTWNSPN